MIQSRVKNEAMRRTTAAVMCWHLAINALIPGMGFELRLVPLALIGLLLIAAGAILRLHKVNAAGVGVYVIWLATRAAEFQATNLKAALLYVGFIAFSTVYSAALLLGGSHEHE